MGNDNSFFAMIMGHNLSWFFFGWPSQCILSSKRLESTFGTFNQLNNVESSCLMQNFIISIIYKHSKWGADNRCQVPVKGAKI